MGKSLVIAFVAASMAVVYAIGYRPMQAESPRSIWDGVYTDAQATRGEAEQQNNCAACHGTEKYSGEAFTKAWFGRTAFELFDQIKTTMPDDNPVSVSFAVASARLLRTSGEALQLHCRSAVE